MLVVLCLALSHMQDMRVCAKHSVMHTNKNECYLLKMMFISNMIVFIYIYSQIMYKTDIELMSSVIIHVTIDIKTYSYLS